MSESNEPDQEVESEQDSDKPEADSELENIRTFSEDSDDIQKKSKD